MATPEQHLEVEPLFTARVPLTLLFKQGLGEPLTAEEQQTWDVYRKAEEEAERRRSMLGLVDLADVMESGATEPEMLVEDLVVEGEHHLWYGPKESNKTWVALFAAALVMVQKRPVVWVDKEMGRKNLANRLKLIGIPPEIVQQHLMYCEYPVLDCTRESIALWGALLRSRQPALVVVDAQTEVLADAGLNENSGTDIERWMKAYITPARRQGTATLMIDHTGHDDEGRAVASRQKGAAAKLELAFRVVGKKPSPQRVGDVEITLRKNTVAAPVPDKQWFRVGGTPFVLDRALLPPVGDGADSDLGFFQIRQRILALLQQPEVAEGLTQTQIEGMVTGKKTAIREALVSLANDEGSGVRARPGRREGSLLYYAPSRPAGPVPGPGREGREEGREEDGKDGKGREPHE